MPPVGGKPTYRRPGGPPDEGPQPCKELGRALTLYLHASLRVRTDAYVRWHESCCTSFCCMYEHVPKLRSTWSVLTSSLTHEAQARSWTLATKPNQNGAVQLSCTRCKCSSAVGGHFDTCNILNVIGQLKKFCIFLLQVLPNYCPGDWINCIIVRH